MFFRISTVLSWELVRAEGLEPRSPAAAPVGVEAANPAPGNSVLCSVE